MTKFPLFSRVFFFILCPFLIASLLVYYWGRQSIEQQIGVIEVDKISAAVTISYDTFGIPSLNAEHDVDAFYGIGFTHGQYRLWQMEMDRRAATGRLSEVLGEAALSYDIFMRTLSLERHTQVILQQLGTKERQVLDAYVAGVNEGINQLTTLPIEFSYFSFQPTSWTAQDSILKLQLLSLNMALNFSDELLNAAIQHHLSPEIVSELLPQIDELSQELINTVDQAVITQLMTTLPEQFAYPKAAIGSNAWAISGALTASGGAIIANDPHLDNSLPSPFFLVNAHSPELTITGATFPGLPFVVAGRNAHVSWGITSMEADTQDLYIERTEAYDNNRYEVDGKYLMMDVRQETIHIKPELMKGEPKSRLITVRRTHRGPVISDLLTNSKNTLSLRWTGEDEDGGTFSSLLAMNYAQNANEFIEATTHIVAPIMNIVYADDQGQIGRIAPGKYPIRTQAFGLLPTPGWLSQNDWQGFIITDQWPQERNPVSGIIVAANQKIVTDNYPYYLSGNWSPQLRANRITARIHQEIKQSQATLTSRHMQRIQMDSQHPLAAQIHTFFEHFPTNERIKSTHVVANLLKDWDGQMSGASPEAAIIAVWLAHLNELIFIDEIKQSGVDVAVFQGITQQLQYPVIEKILMQQAPEICAYDDGENQYHCDQVIEMSLMKALRELTQKLGDDPNDWQWSKLAQTHFYHFPFSGSEYINLSSTIDNKILAAIFHRSYPGESTNESVNTKGVSLDSQQRFQQLYGASFRQIIHFGAEKENKFILSTGQSGNLFSDHYTDMLMPFNRGDYVTIDTLQHDPSIEITKKPSIIIQPKAQKAY